MKLYQEDCYLTQAESYVVTSTLIDDCTALTIDPMLFHPEGGGQPSDTGKLVVNGEAAAVTRLIKQKGDFLIVLDRKLDCHDEIGFGEEVVQYIDWDMRYNYMKSHTSSHLLMSATKRKVEGYVPKGVVLKSDGGGGEIVFQCRGISDQDCTNIFLDASSHITNGVDVSVVEFGTIAKAEDMFGELLRADSEMKFKGPVSVVVIDGVDVNPCGGTHVRNTREIGAIEFVRCAFDQNKSLGSIEFKVR